MNTVIDVYDVTEPSGTAKAWEDIEFPASVPLPVVGEIINLCREPEALYDTSSDPWRVVGREFTVQRNRTDNTPQMRVCLTVVRFERREYCG